MKAKSVWIPMYRGILGYGLVVLAQVLSACAGLVFVNLLSTGEFALFTVCTALLQALVAQSDLGTLAAVGYFYREHSGWTQFGNATLSAIASLRSKFFLLAGIILTVFFIASDAAQGATAVRTALLLCITLVTAWFGMVSALQVTTLRIRGDVNTSVGIEAAASFARLALAVGMVGLALMSAEAALLTSLLSMILSFLVGRIYIHEVPLGLAPRYNKDMQHRVFRYVLPLIPGSLYYTLQPSILIWLSAIYGNTQRVAEIGAVSRIGQIIAFVGVGLGLFVLPHLAALRDERSFRRDYLFIWLIICGLASFIFLAVTLARGEILLLLGPKYASLDNEVILVAGTSLLHVAANYAVLVNRLKGWNKVEPLSTVALFIGQAILIAWLPLDSTASVLVLGLFYALLCVVITVGINIIGFLRPSWAAIS